MSVVYLCILQLETKLIIHEGFKPRIVIICILLGPSEMNLADGLLTCQVTFDRDVTGIDEKMCTPVSRDAAKS